MLSTKSASLALALPTASAILRVTDDPLEAANRSVRLVFANSTPAWGTLSDYNGTGCCHGDPMIDWIRSYRTKRTRLRKLRLEHARSVAHRSALLRLGTSSNAALVLALQQIDLQIAAVEHEIRLMGAEPPATAIGGENQWVR